MSRIYECRSVAGWSLGVAILCGAAVLVSVGGCSEQGSHGGGHGGFQMPPTVVETATVVLGAVADRFSTIGTIEAAEAITVVSELDGIVTDLPFREGDPVTRGTLLAQLDDSTLRAEVERNEALRDQAQSTHGRVQAVVEQLAGAPQDLDDAAAGLKVAQANLAFARARLAKTRITAPFDGFVGTRQISRGAFVRAGTPITQLASIHELRVTFSVPERLLGKLQRGSEVSVSTSAFPGVELNGRLDVVDPVLDPETRSARVIARVKNPDDLFRPGMSAKVDVLLSERANALTVPNEAVFVQGIQPYVYLIQADSTVVRTAVTLGTRSIAAVEVLGGLEAGQSIVRTGHQKVFDGGRVMPVSSADAGAQQQ